MTNHVLPSGAAVSGYMGQLASTGHKFGEHTLTTVCKCMPDVMVSTTGLTTVHHK